MWTCDIAETEPQLHPDQHRSHHAADVPFSRPREAAASLIQGIVAFLWRVPTKSAQLLQPVG